MTNFTRASKNHTCLSFEKAMAYLIGFFALLALISPSPARAASTLTITPITWNVIGLDSNTPAGGPYRFPVGVRVCSSVATTNVTVAWTWDSANSYIDLRSGSLSTITIPSIAAGGCSDAYFEVEVTRVQAAYDTTRQYHITATDLSGSISTPTPRELYVEHLISQNRNGVTSIKLNGTTIPAGGTMNLIVGNTYEIELAGFTATNGYNQLESFINFPNTIFQILDVRTAYSADSNVGRVPNPDDKLYADACGWDNDPASLNYRSCTGGDDKAGGNVTITYTVKIIGGAGTSQRLDSLLYDFSGSSYHYNAGFSASSVIAAISSVTLVKSFAPKTILPGGTSTLTLRITNPSSVSLTGVHLEDNLPGGMTVASVPSLSYTGCGTASPATLTGGAASLSFSNITVAPVGVCTITLTVTAPEGSYVNTTGHLFINNTDDTGSVATDSLVASTAPACRNQPLATWTFETAAGTTLPPPFTTKAANVTTAAASYTGAGLQKIDTQLGSPSPNSWAANGFLKNTTYTATTQPYFDFTVDTSKYSAVSISLRTYGDANWGPTTSNTLRVWGSADGGPFAALGNGALPKSAWSADQTFTPAATGVSTMTFRINADGAQNENGYLSLDNIIITGCSWPAPAPSIAKSFSPNPILKGANSTLTFTLTNTAAHNQPLTGVAFTDVLPAGLSVANSSSTQCGGTLTTTASTRGIALVGGSIAAGGTCTFSVQVTGAIEGQYTNVSGFVSSTETGTSTSYATAPLTVIAPPFLSKSFNPGSILVGGTSTLSFIVSNPNTFMALNGVGFSDPLPSGLTAVPATINNVCGAGSLTISSNSLALTGGSLPAGGSCTYGVTVTGTTAGMWNNTTTAVTSAEGGTGNAATAVLGVIDQVATIDLVKQVSSPLNSGPWKKFVDINVGVDVYYRFKVYNSGYQAFQPISVSDAKLGLPPAVCTWTDSTGAAFNPASTPLQPLDTAYCVVGPVTAVEGLNPNTATASGTYGGNAYTSNPSTAEYWASTPTAVSVSGFSARSGWSPAWQVLTLAIPAVGIGFLLYRRRRTLK